jgi:hypothetical protein
MTTNFYGGGVNTVPKTIIAILRDIDILRKIPILFIQM